MTDSLRSRLGLVARWIAGLACLIGAGCAAPDQHETGYVTVAVPAGPNNLDPRLGSDEVSARVAQLVFSSLMQIGDDLRVRPRLAERLAHPDPLTYVVSLRRGVRFHDGHELTSADVVFTYSQLLDPAFISPYKGAFKTLQSVTADDRYTVTFRLREPFAAFPIQLVTPPVVPVGADARLATHPVGTGPYRFVRYETDDRLVLQAFDGYFEGAPRNRGVIVRVIPDATMRGLEMQKGSVDLVVNDMPPDIVYQLERRGQSRVTRAPGVDFSYLGFNLRDPVLADVRVRRAIGYAVDRQAIVEHLRRGFAREAVGLIPPIAWAFEGDVTRFTFDPARAKALLDAAGYRDPDGDGPRARLTLSLKISGNEETRLQSTVIQQNLAAVGIALDIRSYEFATFYADVLKGNFQMFSLQWVGGALVDPDILRRVFHSTQTPPAGFNRGYYHNVHVDRLIDRASQATDDAERLRALKEVQRLVADDAPYIPLWNRINVVMATPALANVHVGAIGDFTFLKDVAWTAD